MKKNYLLRIFKIFGIFDYYYQSFISRKGNNTIPYFQSIFRLFEFYLVPFNPKHSFYLILRQLVYNIFEKDVKYHFSCVKPVLKFYKIPKIYVDDCMNIYIYIYIDIYIFNLFVFNNG